MLLEYLLCAGLCDPSEGFPAVWWDSPTTLRPLPSRGWEQSGMSQMRPQSTGCSAVTICDPGQVS